MMPRERVRTDVVFKFDELEESAKERARDDWRSHGLDYEWWDGVYEDAKRIGAKIEGFDLGRRQSIEFRLTENANEVARRIIADHGRETDTFREGIDWILGMNWKGGDRSGCTEDEGEEYVKEFERALGECYWRILRDEEEYLNSDESVDESLRINDYEFTEEGRMA